MSEGREGGGRKGVRGRGEYCKASRKILHKYLDNDDEVEAQTHRYCDDIVLSQRTRPIPSERLSASDRHFYVPSSQIDGTKHKVPNFCQWIKFCHLLREGSQARIAVKVLMNYMDTIARRVSLNREIVCVANIVTMLSISAMIYYAFNIISSPQEATVILPQILIDTITRFDQKNCLTKQRTISGML